MKTLKKHLIFFCFSKLCSCTICTFLAYLESLLACSAALWDSKILTFRYASSKNTFATNCFPLLMFTSLLHRLICIHQLQWLTPRNKDLISEDVTILFVFKVLVEIQLQCIKKIDMLSKHDVVCWLLLNNGFILKVLNSRLKRKHSKCCYLFLELFNTYVLGWKHHRRVKVF